MPVKVVIKRKFKDPDFQKISKMLVQARFNAMQKSGYISSETLCGMEDPNEVVVLSMWESKGDWDAFENCGPRQELESAFSEMLESPTQCSVYKMGMTAG